MISSLLILVTAFLSLIILMIIHEFGHFIIAKKFGVKVEEFGVGYPPRICAKKMGETVYSLNWLPLGAFVRIQGEEGEDGDVDDYRSFIGLPIWRRVMIVIGGVVAFWIAAIFIFTAMFAIGADLPVTDNDAYGLNSPELKIVSVSENSPAGIAGVKTGDTVKSISVDGSATSISKVSEFQGITGNNKGKEITITLERQGKEIKAVLTPRENAPEGQGIVGVGLQRMASLIEKTAWYMAPIKGISYTWESTVSVVKSFYIMISGLFTAKGLPAGSEFAGPIGITVFLANAISYGPGFFLYFIGMIAVALAVFNLFPIPALDGGKLVFLLIEKIKRKPVSAKVEQNITVVFFSILILLSLFITIRFDIPRLWEFVKSAF